MGREVLGRVLGPAKGEGNEMAQWVLKANRRVIPRRSVPPLHVAEIHSETEKSKGKLSDELIERRWGTAINPPNPVKDDPDDVWDEYKDDDEDPRIISEIKDTVDTNGRLLDQQPAYDRLINAELQLQLGEELVPGKVIQRAVDPEGRATGEYHENPMLNSHIYEVEFHDGQVEEYAANVIAETCSPKSTLKASQLQ
jgi:hypothetical protein